MQMQRPYDPFAAKKFELEIVVDGVVLPVIQHDGKYYVAAPRNKDYQLRFKTPYSGRHLAVTSVDGLDIMTGKTASTAAGGYVLSGGSQDVPGFRLNNDEVAAFRFGARGKSYAAKLDKPQNIGVIAVVFYAEKQRYRPMNMGATTRGGIAAAGVGHDLGTEFGKRTEHKVTTVDFERGVEVARIVIQYASRTKLVQAGIIKKEPLGEVVPFPGDVKKPDTGCKPPKGGAAEEG